MGDPTSSPREAKTSGGSIWKLAGFIIVGVERPEQSFKFATLSGGRLGDGVKYTLLGALSYFLPTFFSTRSCRMARQTAAPSVPKHVFPCKEVPIGGPSDNLPFAVILGA